MAVAILVLTILGIFATSMAVLTFQPATFDLAYTNDFWSDTNIVDSNLAIMRDRLYTATIAAPIVIIGVLALWAYLSVNRRDDL